MGIADKILKNMNLFVDGFGFAGNVEEFKPPKLALKTDDYRAGGMDAPVSIEMGMEGLECSFVLKGHFPEVLRKWGVIEENKVQLTARGSLESYSGTVIPVKINLRGTITEVEDGAWKPGENNTQTFTMKLDYYKRVQDGWVLHEIDIPNMIRIIDGVDQLAKRRNALGL